MKRIFEIPQICSGCGSCAAGCDAISMEENEVGIYRPKVDDAKCIQCQKCVKLCPMLQENSIEAFRLSDIKENKMNYSPAAGSYLSCYEGYLDKLRKISSSGGFCTSLLQRLLESGEVDGVYCVGQGRDSKNLYEYRYVTDAEELLRCAKSSYYPVNLEETLEKIRTQQSGVAITALPCAAKAIRLAMKRDKKLQKNIKYIIGLFCGGLPGKEMVHYVAQKNGISVKDIVEIKFREKDPKYRCNNYAMRISTQTGTLISHAHGEDFGFAYRNYLFHNTSCFCCTDVFCEWADIAFGDAWFPEYNEDTWGTSVCIVRDETLDRLMKEVCGDTIKEISAERCVKAQENVGLVAKKKRRSRVFRRIMSRRYHILAPQLPGNTKKNARAFLDYWQASAKLYVSSISEKKWCKVKNGKCTVSEYEAYMKRRLTILKKMRLIR